MLPDAQSNLPRGGLGGLRRYARYDPAAGFLVFLIALPLCLGIALACGYPPIAGVFTAVIGSILATFISNSELTIKGPAAGLIVIAIGCVQDFGGDGAIGGFTATDMTAYRMALGVGVAAAVLQILFALFRTGILGEFFPTSAVHGMLAAIGVIIIAKQLPVALGVSVKGEPLELLALIPEEITHINPRIGLIGLLSLVIMFGYPLIRNRYLKRIPAPLVVLAVAVPLGMVLDLSHAHSNTLEEEAVAAAESGDGGATGDRLAAEARSHMPAAEQHGDALVNVPQNMFNAVTLPDFSGLAQPKAWKWVIMFALIGSLESLLSAKAVDLIDPWKRKTNLDRDLLAVGAGNLAAAFAGGLPMISEIVRSRANIDNGARTRFAAMYHGLFLLGFVALVPTLINQIPQAALGAMLVYTGFRLAHPREFVHVFRIGPEQLAIYVVTIVAVLATDLLAGIAIGICMKFLIHTINGVPLRSLFKPYLDVEEAGPNTVRIMARQSAVFSNWIPFKRQIERLGLIEGRNVIVDLSETKVVDHSVMEKLHELDRDFTQAGLSLVITGLDTHQPRSAHPHSARRKGLATIRRLTVVAPASLEAQLEQRFVELGASGFTVTECSGAGRRRLAECPTAREPGIRIEVLATIPVAQAMLAWLRREILPDHAVTACLETVEVLREDDFVSFTESEEPLLELVHG